ncbi:MAG: hypothetical protein KDH20_07310 [Rhodocyclaceae bacterium]|nr:hypothetical protein [Rhodocyclaceae bacterium]
MRWLLVSLVALAPGLAQPASVSICYNYGCLSEERVEFDADLLAGVAASLAGAPDAAAERTRLAAVVGRLYRFAGRHLPIHADRAGDYLDEGVYGKMDCIDHAASTTRLLELLDGEGMLRFHRVMPQQRRTRFLIFQHFSAAVEELAADGEGGGAQYVIDSWFVEHGEAAVVLPLEAWLDGEGPNVQ